ncbi:MAG: Fic family protein [Tepidisphaeraceae bacterium]
MHIPQKPPATAECFEAWLKQSANFNQMLAPPPGSGNADRYRHWDKIRFLEPPKGLSHKAWWGGIKLFRAGLAKPLPLKDVHGQPFTVGLPDLAQRRLHEFDCDAAGHILVSDNVATPEMRDRYVISSLMEEAITSSQIEGAATTRLVAKEMLRTGRKPRNEDERMIANNYAAIRHIRTIINEPLTRDRVFALHRLLTEGTLKDPSAVGRFRRPDEDVRIEDDEDTVLHRPPPATELDERMTAMCAFGNGDTPERFVHPVVRAIALHFWLAYDHPFVDGNGRCARALFYWCMLRNGYWLTEFISISSAIRKAHIKYGRAFLYVETDANDLTYFLLYHLELIRTAIDDLKSHLRRKMAETRDVEKLLRDNANFNHRQIALLSHSLRHPDARYTIASHQRSHGVVYETARTDLLDLVSKSLFVSMKRGKTFEFRPVPRIAQLLKQAPQIT